jgi:cytochrome c oxidase assembly protein subunit 11
MASDRTLLGDNRRMVGKLAVVAVLMFGFGYALVPMYRSICEALGINVLSLSERAVPGNSKATPANTQVDRSRTVTVEFDANARGPWDFKPAKRYVEVHPGELTTVMYEFRNIQNRTMAAQAIPSYAPKQATPHFNKLECFCFNEYTLQPGESRQWPVVFVIDPKLPKDVKTITLSYTFFEVGGKVAATPNKESRL